MVEINWAGPSRGGEERCQWTALPITALIILAPFLADAQAQRPLQRDMKAEFTAFFPLLLPIGTFYKWKKKRSLQ